MANCKACKIFNVFKTLCDTVRNYSKFLLLDMVIKDRKALEK